ncbi:serine O-acetyltransferase [Rhodoferax mekongensis]|uniref:Serine acetyltransferase n=1 Tax=Rhodoferax mekongensis TaxID=3068341 RepID=A0ABZ0B3I2_9BURK|nr:serine acetyltransferase [Rhodoferax sp. TBRC 17307]WNO06249.1 serine acetyltransferase [Rhodoferax sp. TBRC 17307]
MRDILQDWKVNTGNTKGRLVLLSFRLAQKIRRAPKPIFWLGIPYLVFYRLLIEWVLCIELPWNTQVGPSLRLYHGMGLVVNDQTVIGRNVALRHNTTIGVKETLPFGTRAAPTIGDDVDIGAHVVILGPITVGSGARIGAGSVVVKDVPEGATVVGNPARVIHIATMPEATCA